MNPRKNIILLIALMLVTISGFAQVGGAATKNYIHTITYKKGYQESQLGSVSGNDKIETINYFDGLGRPIQMVAVRQGGKNSTGDDTDLITPIVYDKFGRQEIEYLPLATDANDGKYNLDPISAIQSYYHTNFRADFPTLSVVNSNPYSEKDLEASPLNRVLKQAAPGESWKLGNGHEVVFDYQSNATGEVKKYKVTLTLADNTYTPTLVLNSSYTAGELYKTITYDENHISGLDHSTEEFKDKLGRVVLKRTYNTSVKHDTYYVYDDYGNLTYVLPPKAEPDTALPDATKLSELCYQYRYDDRNRLVEKKIPGKGWEYIVYNKLDQPIMSQDSNLQAQNKWLFTKYDVFGRVAFTGITNTSSNRISLQVSANSTTTNYVTKTGSSTLAGTTIYYNNTGYPSTVSEVLTINYYDNYTFNNDGLVVPGTNYYGAATISGTNVKGLSTCTKAKVLGTTNTWITTVSGYDKHKRPIWVGTQNNYLGTTDYVESKLNDIIGWVAETKTRHIKSGATLTTFDKFTYDHSGKVLTHTNKINTGAEQSIAVNEYDNLGQLKRKKVGGLATATELQVVDYSYNIRGWLKGINDVSNIGPVDLFAFKINYNSKDITATTGYTPLYNGNISETIWKTTNDVSSNKTRGYAYKYDSLNRITGADYGVKTTGSYSLASGFDVGIGSYDKNGNIMSLWRDDATNGHKIDQLTYTYQAYSNKLNIVSDAILNTASLNEEFKDDYNSTSADTTIDYAYDANGNMRTDSNKGITSNITYNHLNLPTYVALPGGNISYIYDATGVKLKKIVSNGATTVYAGNYVYEKPYGGTETLKFFNHPEGYVDVNTGVYMYVYQYKDHLGNVRLSYSDSDNNGSIDPNTEIISEKNYYPFGLEHKGYNNVVNGQEYNYKTFQGQERTEDLGLNVLEFKYRIHDPAIGRFWQIDPLAESFPHNGTYNFSENRVIDAIELEGLESYVVTGRAFIPQDKLSNPTPWGKSDSYKGDNRNYYSATSTAFRTEQSVRLNFDNNTSETLSNTASPTIGLDKNGNEVQRSSAGEAGTVSSDIEKGGVNLEFSATNKLSKSENPLTPSIDAQFNISITPNEDGTFNFNVDANVDGFPAYEVWVTDETNGGSFLLFGRNPIESGEGPLSLYGNGEHSGTTSGNSETRRAENGKVEFKDKKNDID